MSSTELQRSLELEKKVICSSVAVLAHFIPKGPTAPRLHHDMTMSLLSRLHLFSDAFENEEPEALKFHDDAAVVRDGITIRCDVEPLKPVMHPSLVVDGQAYDWVSAYSSAWYWLHKQEWFRLQLDVDFSGGKLDNSDEPIMFHGTEWGSAMKIVGRSQGFIVGQGTHRVRHKSFSGCWCVDNIGDAIRRSNPERYRYLEGFSKFSCPVALEIQAVDLRQIPGKETYCAPSPMGKVHRGLLIRAVHFNKNFMVNYLKLEDPVLRARLSQDPQHCRRCACGWCGQVCLPEDTWYWNWQRSSKGLWYSERCYRVITAEDTKEWL